VRRKCIIRKRKTSSPRSVMSSDIVGSLKRQTLRQTKNPQLYLDTTRKNRLIRGLSIAYVCLAGVVFLSTRCLRARRRASGTWRARLCTHPRRATRGAPTDLGALGVLRVLGALCVLTAVCCMVAG